MVDDVVVVVDDVCVTVVVVAVADVAVNVVVDAVVVVPPRKEIAAVQSSAALIEGGAGHALRSDDVQITLMSVAADNRCDRLASRRREMRMPGVIENFSFFAPLQDGVAIVIELLLALKQGSVVTASIIVALARKNRRPADWQIVVVPIIF